MGKFEDLTGQRFGRLTVIKQGEYYICPANGYRYVQWFCKCDCGNERTVRTCALRSGDTQSCGCIAKEILIKRNTTHNKYHSRLHSIWSNMKNRCSNPNSKRYKDYGGRGITVCEEWKENFENFYNWAVQNGYEKELTLDRVDTNKGYNQENCRWATYQTQANNTRTNKYIVYKKETHTLAEWCRILEKPYKTMHDRLKSGWSIEDTFTKPIKANKIKK